MLASWSVLLWRPERSFCRTLCRSSDTRLSSPNSPSSRRRGACVSLIAVSMVCKTSQKLAGVNRLEILTAENIPLTRPGAVQWFETAQNAVFRKSYAGAGDFAHSLALSLPKKSSLSTFACARELCCAPLQRPRSFPRTSVYHRSVSWN